MHNRLKRLPRQTIGKAGYDFASCRKELTVIMTLRMKHEAFVQAVDRLFSTVTFPFNLIVVEGNAPEPVRRALESRQKRHQNIVILYSFQRLSFTEAYNLALPHLKTRFAFFVDNEVLLAADTLPQLMHCARVNKADIVCPRVLDGASPGAADSNRLHSFEFDKDRAFEPISMRSFLITRKALRRVGELDGNSDPVLADIELTSKAGSKELVICTEPAAGVRSNHPVSSFMFPSLSFRRLTEPFLASIQRLMPGTAAEKDPQNAL